MSGLTSYPRTSGFGGSNLLRFKGLLQQLVLGNVSGNMNGNGTSFANLDHVASALIQALTALSASANDHAMLVQYAIDARNQLFIARLNGSVTGGHYLLAMNICAQHWKILFSSIAATSLRARHDAAIARMNAAIRRVAINRAKEEAGTIAWLYNASALLGQDLNASLAAHGSPLVGGNYQASYVNGALVYLECAASYNINQFVVVSIPNSPLPLVLTGEAKGGASGYGQVSGPAQLLALHLVSSISQRDILYVRSRAFYMEKDNKTTPSSRARRAAGRIINQAFKDHNLVYLTARGNIVNGVMTEQQEGLQCL